MDEMFGSIPFHYSAVAFVDTIRDRLPGEEAQHTLAPGLGHTLCGRRIAQHTLDGAGDRRRILARNHQAGLLVDHDLAETGPIGGDHRTSAAQGLTKDHPEGLARKAGADDDVGQREVSGKVAVWNGTQKCDLFSKAKLPNQALEL